MTNSFLLEIHPELLNLSKSIFEDIANNIVEIIESSVNIEGISLFSYNGKQSLIIAKNKDYFEKLKIVGDIVGELNPSSFFSELGGEVEYRGKGHMVFPDFEVFFARLADNLMISFIASDIHMLVFEKSKEIIDLLKNILQKEHKTNDDIENDSNETYINLNKDSSLPDKNEIKEDNKKDNKQIDSKSKINDKNLTSGLNSKLKSIDSKNKTIDENNKKMKKSEENTKSTVKKKDLKSILSSKLKDLVED